jgi:hypothetical protein
LVRWSDHVEACGVGGDYRGFRRLAQMRGDGAEPSGCGTRIVLHL